MRNKIKLFKKYIDQNNPRIELLIQSMDAKELSKAVFKVFYFEIKQTISFALKDFKFMPLDVNDITNEFLFYAGKWIKKYEYREDSSIYSFIKVLARNFCLNKVKYWSRDKRIHNCTMVSIDSLHYLKDEDAEKTMTANIDAIDYENLENHLDYDEKNKLKILFGGDQNICSTQKLNEYRRKLYEKINHYYNN